MAGITLEEAQTALNEHLAASTAVCNNQSYEIKGRKMTRANLAEIREGIKFWNDLVKEISRTQSGGRRSRTIVNGR